jgi:hypothetical protein
MQIKLVLSVVISKISVISVPSLQLSYSEFKTFNKHSMAHYNANQTDSICGHQQNQCHQRSIFRIELF